MASGRVIGRILAQPPRKPNGQSTKAAAASWCSRTTHSGRDRRSVGPNTRGHVGIGSVGPSLVDQVQAIRDHRLTPTDLVDQALDRLSTVDAELRAFVLVASDRAREEARTLTAHAAAGNWHGPLHGIPVAV